MRLLALLNISSINSTRIPSAHTYNNQRSQQSAAQNAESCPRDQPFTAALSSLCSTELPSAAISFLDFPENTPETAPRTFRFRPAFCPRQRLLWKFWAGYSWKAYTGASFRAMLTTINHTRARRACVRRGRGVLAGFFGDCGGRHDGRGIGLEIRGTRFERQDSRFEKREVR
jgi:hypothetical protein